MARKKKEKEGVLVKQAKKELASHLFCCEDFAVKFESGEIFVKDGAWMRKGRDEGGDVVICAVCPDCGQPIVMPGIPEAEPKAAAETPAAEDAEVPDQEESAPAEEAEAGK